MLCQSQSQSQNQSRADEDGVDYGMLLEARAHSSVGDVDHDVSWLGFPVSLLRQATAASVVAGSRSVYTIQP